MKFPHIPHLRLLRKIHHTPIYPIMLTIYPILFLYAFNIREVSLNMLWLPLVSSVLVATILLYVAKKVMKSWNRAALWFTGFGILFFGYGHVASLLGPSVPTMGILIPVDVTLLVLFSIILTSFSWLLWRNRHFHLGQLNVAINIVSFVLIMVSAINIIPSEIGKLALTTPQESTTVNAALPNPANPMHNPDVYYLVFDRYGGEQTMKDLYNFDNTEFYNALEAKGFYIAKDSKTNYPSTSFSLSSTLNMSYHPQLSTNALSYPSQAEHIYPLLKDYEVGKVFKDHGYKVIQLGSWFTYTHQEGVADENYTLSSSRQIVKLDAFTSKLISTTALYPIIEEVAPGVIQNNNFESHYLFTEYQRQKFTEITQQNGPKFVFSHILVPHDPFVYDSQCNLLDEQFSNNRDIVRNYTDMVQCANKIAITMIDQIRESAANANRPDPVIVIQGDEGPYPLLDWRFKVGPYNSQTTDQLLERFRILNAYYFPSQDYKQLYQSITPVNSFKVLFNDLFAANYQQLPDRNYRFKDGEHMFDYIDVTEQLNP